MISEYFLPKPHCPSAEVSLCAVGEQYSEICEKLLRWNIEVFPIAANDKLSEPVQYHADLQIGVLEGKTLAVGKGEAALKRRLEQQGFTVMETKRELSNRYPQEAMLDFLVSGDTLIGNPTSVHSVDNELLLKFSQIIKVKQGYTKCSCVTINDHAFITADAGITAACRPLGFDVLQIRPGYIELPGYTTGFIGGCCGFITPDCLAVCGNLDTHPDAEEIKTFLKQYHISIRQICDGSLKDIGGIIPLKQKHP